MNQIDLIAIYNFHQITRTDDDDDDADKSAPLKYRDSPLNGRWNFQKKKRHYKITNNWKLVSKILLEIIDNIT